MAQNDKHSAFIVLAERLKTARASFAASKATGLVAGEFDADVWQYKGSNLLFTEIGSSRIRDQAVITLSKIAGEIARCYLAHNILLQVSAELAISRLNAFRWLAKIIGNQDQLWQSLSTSILNRTVEEIKALSSRATTYHRATGLGSFIGFLNQMHARVNGEEHRFCQSFIKWKHGIPNPIRSTLEITSQDRESRTKKLYEPNLHIALATARATIKSDPSIEPRPGYDRIRLEALVFSMALGLRVGELCSLPKNAVERDTDTQLCFARVPTEKSALCGATAIAKVWEEPILEAYSYLLESCSEARNRAREIEQTGFAFIRRLVRAAREASPLTDGQSAQLTVLGLDHENYYFIPEIASCLSVSTKELDSGGKYGSCLISLPRLVGARMASWIDERFIKWDWPMYSTKHSRTRNIYNLSSLDIAKFSNTSKSSIAKARWYIEDLRAFLSEMRADGFFEPDANPDNQCKELWRKRWKAMRAQMLSHRGGGAGASCVAVNINILIDNLKCRYANYLSTHFKEEFDSHGNTSGGGFVGNRVRKGSEERLSDHLIVVWENQFNSNTTLGILPRPILRSDFYSYLCQNAQKKTVFERIKILDENMQPFSFTPHHIRRWVTTALLRSGPAEAAIDLWMGRTPHQTRQYDYRTAKERAEYVRERYLQEATLPNDVLGKKVKFWRADGMTEEQIELLVTEKLRALHYSPWGTCSKDLYLSPCNKGLMCLRGFGSGSACESFQIDPTDMQAKKSITQLRSQYIKILNAIEPNYQLVSNSLLFELSTKEPLDQHIAFALDVVRGCDSALSSYELCQGK